MEPKEEMKREERITIDGLIHWLNQVSTYHSILLEKRREIHFFESSDLVNETGLPVV